MLLQVVLRGRDPKAVSNDRLLVQKYLSSSFEGVTYSIDVDDLQECAYDDEDTSR